MNSILCHQLSRQNCLSGSLTLGQKGPDPNLYIQVPCRRIKNSNDGASLKYRITIDLRRKIVPEIFPFDLSRYCRVIMPFKNPLKPKKVCTMCNPLTRSIVSNLLYTWNFYLRFKKFGVAFDLIISHLQ